MDNDADHSYDIDKTFDGDFGTLMVMSDLSRTLHMMGGLILCSM